MLIIFVEYKKIKIPFCFVCELPHLLLNARATMVLHNTKDSLDVATELFAWINGARPSHISIQVKENVK